MITLKKEILNKNFKLKSYFYQKGTGHFGSASFLHESKIDLQNKILYVLVFRKQIERSQLLKEK